MFQKSGSEARILYWFLIIWTALNLLQASLTGLHADEAYYWLYSKFLDWGYFDHPPMVGLFIHIGEWLGHSALNLRLLTVIASTLGVYVLWLIVKQQGENIKLFIGLVSSILIFHVYGFVTAPDSPLLLFGILFLYVYQRYVYEDRAKWAILLSLIIAGLLYSKYHGVLILFFTILSNFKLIRRPSFWGIVALSGLLFVPHIYWQFENGFPSLYYHLFDRSAKPYRSEYTFDYLAGQLLVAGPLVGWFLYRVAFKFKGNDLFLRAVKFNFVGIIVFFLLTTFKGRVEPHWTLLAFPPLLIISYIYLQNLKLIPGWLKTTALINICLILLIRFAFMFPIPGLKNLKMIRGFSSSKAWAKEVKEKAGDNNVIIQGGFQEASLYDFYNNTTRGFAYDTRYYRKTQFDIWPLEDSLRNKPAYYVTYDSQGADIIEDTLKTKKGIFYGRNIKAIRTYQKVNIRTEPLTDNWKAGGLRSINIRISNPYQESISFSNYDEKWKVYLECGFIEKGKVLQFNPVISKFNKVVVEPLGSVTIPVIIRGPAKPGKYNLVFSIRTEPFPGSRNSSMIPVNIN
ncbi:glycosyltransferase family 39 protein [Flavihumibacter sp. R14]|nr:glycosyltransferase family 39 protein [Flavihumibacter soli]